jgi:hypothetical protein
MDTRGKGAVESMRHVRMLGLCLMAVFAFGAITAAGASAKFPELGKCAEVETGGKYTDSACLVKAHAKGKGEEKVYEGAYEWKPNSEEEGGGILETSTTAVTFETPAGYKIECSHMQNRSSMFLFNTDQAITPLWLLEGCQSEGQPCTTLSIGSDPGIISNKLFWLEEEGRGWAGKLGFVEGQGTPDPIVGLSFTSDNRETGEREPFFTPISCEGSLGTVLIGGDNEHTHKDGNNSFIGTIGPVDTPVEEFTVTYNSSPPGVQTPDQFGHGKQQYLQAFVHNEWEPVAITAKMTFEVGLNREIRTMR